MNLVKQFRDELYLIDNDYLSRTGCGQFLS